MLIKGSLYIKFENFEKPQETFIIAFYQSRLLLSPVVRALKTQPIWYFQFTKWSPIRANQFAKGSVSLGARCLYVVSTFCFLVLQTDP